MKEALVVSATPIITKTIEPLHYQTFTDQQEAMPLPAWLLAGVLGTLDCYQALIYFPEEVLSANDFLILHVGQVRQIASQHAFFDRSQ